MAIARASSRQARQRRSDGGGGGGGHRDKVGGLSEVVLYCTVPSYLKVGTVDSTVAAKSSLVNSSFGSTISHKTP